MQFKNKDSRDSEGQFGNKGSSETRTAETVKDSLEIKAVQKHGQYKNKDSSKARTVQKKG